MDRLALATGLGKAGALGLMVALSPLVLPFARSAAESGTPPNIVEQALAGPLKDVQHLVFCTRLPYDDPHWYANIGYYCDDENAKAYPGNGSPDASKLWRLNLRTGELAVLLDARGGTVRDPQVHYDAETILFSYRPAGTDFFHLYEIGKDGSSLGQVTDGPFDDYEPTYLPDGGIAFVSTRCRRWVNCWKTQVGVIYRCDGDGSNVQRISANTEHDNTPWVMPDGRILYTRWEYVDRSQVEFHHLWTMNPDGTGQMVYYGNMHPKTVMIDAKPIPGTRRVVASFSPGHGANEHAGIAAVVSVERGPDEESTARRLHRGRLVRDPYPLSEDCFLVARDRRVMLMNRAGEMQVLHTHEGESQVHEPRPILARPRERIIPPRVDTSQDRGVMVLADIYTSRNLEGVERGDIKKLLVLESLPKPVNFSGGPDLTSWLGTFTLERVLGTVPVEEDGSAAFELPANRQLFFVALDENDLSVKRMHSFTSVMPGETVSCLGCHEHRTRTPENRYPRSPSALERSPSKIRPFDGFPDVLDFNRDIQPILDRHCVPCHEPRRREGRVTLVGNLGPTWSIGYFSLLAWRQVADGRNGLGNYAPRTVGSAASPLLRKAEGGHHDVEVPAAEWRTLWLWIESGAPYAGTYAALRNEEEQARAGAAVAVVIRGCWDVIGQRCHSCHTGERPGDGKPIRFPFDHPTETRRQYAEHRTAQHERIVLKNDPSTLYSANLLLDFTQPENSSLLLAPLSEEAGGYGSCGNVFASKGDPDYQRILQALERGKAKLNEAPRFPSPAFQPNPQYLRELKKFGILPATFDLASHHLDVFEADEAYWRSGR